MPAPTPEAIENARLKVAQAKARLQALEARASTLNRKADARRKIILGGLLLDAAMRDPAWETRLNELMERIGRDQDRKAFERWTFRGAPAEWLIRSTPPSSISRPPKIPAATTAPCSTRCARLGPRGVAEQSATLARQIDQEARQRADWGQQTGSVLRDLQRAARELQRVSRGIWWDRLKEWFYAALIGLGLIFAAALVYRWAKEPVIEQHLYGCTGRWNAKTHTCKGGWIPLQAQ